MTTHVVVAGSVDRPRLSGAGRHTSEDELVVVVATQPLPIDQMLTMVSAVAAALKALGRPSRLMVRPHPAEGDARRQAYRAAVGDRDVAFVGSETALNDADVLVTGFSNLAAHAAALDVRTILFWPAASPPPIPFEAMGLAVRAEDGVKLRAVLKDFASNGPTARALDVSRRAYMAENPYLGGGAAALVADAILSDLPGEG